MKRCCYWSWFGLACESIRFFSALVLPTEKKRLRNRARKEIARRVKLEPKKTRMLLQTRSEHTRTKIGMLRTAADCLSVSCGRPVGARYWKLVLQLSCLAYWPLVYFYLDATLKFGQAIQIHSHWRDQASNRSRMTTFSSHRLRRPLPTWRRSRRNSTSK